MMFLTAMLMFMVGWSQEVRDPRAWGPDGPIIVPTSGDQYRPSTASTSSFVMTAWQDDRALAGPDLGWQIIAPQGTGILPIEQTVWPREGIQSEPVVLASRTGRCTLVWKESSNGSDWSVWCRELGVGEMGDQAPIPVSASGGSCSNLQIGAISKGDVVILWEASGEDGSRDVVLARVNPSRQVLGPLVVCDHAALTGDASLVINGSLAFVVWTDWRSGFPAIYGQCWDLQTNAMLWPTNGWLLSPEAPWAEDACPFASDEGYLGLTYWTQEHARAMLEYQIVDYQQNFRFFPPLVVARSEMKGDHDVTSYLDGGAVVGWTDPTENGGEIRMNLHAQARDFSGQVVWTTTVRSDGASLRDVQLVGQGQGVDILWNERIDGQHHDPLRAQRLTLAGVPQWSPGGVRVSDEEGGQENANAVGAFGGSLVVAWEDSRDPRVTRIAMQRMN
jgi:hypothetical protein